MKVCGIIAEYNPFHSGHAYQISRARQLSGCDHVIAVMSGDFVQRGAPALADKYMRAHMALSEGADLVLMLPVYGSTASAEGFARAGVAALLTTGIVAAISFGCENTAICSDDYLCLAEELAHESSDFQSALSEALALGLPYAQARVKAVRSCYGKDFDLSLLDSPNNLLAFEYIRALKYFGADKNIVPVKRQGSYHDADFCQPAGTSDRTNGGALAIACENASPDAELFASASACRKALLSNSDSEVNALEHARQIPADAARALSDYAASYQFLQENDLSLILHYMLLTHSFHGYETFLDCSADLSSRICKQLNDFESFSGFCDRLNNKSVTRARIARVLTHILLQLPAQMPSPLISDDGILPYLRVLGFRQSADALLHELKAHAKAPLITRVPEAQRILPEAAMDYFRQDLLASEIYRSVLLQKCGHCYPDDYRRRIEIV